MFTGITYENQWDFLCRISDLSWFILMKRTRRSHIFFSFSSNTVVRKARIRIHIIAYSHRIIQSIR